MTGRRGGADIEVNVCATTSTLEGPKWDMTLAGLGPGPAGMYPPRSGAP